MFGSYSSRKWEVLKVEYRSAVSVKPKTANCFSIDRTMKATDSTYDCEVQLDERYICL
jgi:hypothetical protein